MQTPAEHTNGQAPSATHAAPVASHFSGVLPEQRAALGTHVPVQTPLVQTYGHDVLCAAQLPMPRHVEVTLEVPEQVSAAHGVPAA